MFATPSGVRETSSTTGTGTVTLGGAVAGARSFASAGVTDGTKVPYRISHVEQNEWEVGIGTYSSGTLARDSVLASSNANALVAFSAGPKHVFICDAGEYALSMYAPSRSTISVFEAVPFTAYGHSFLVTGASAAEGSYPQRLARRLNTQTLSKRGVGGQRISATIGWALSNETASSFSGGVSHSWVPGTYGLVLVDTLINESNYWGGPSAGDPAHDFDLVKDELRTFLRLMRSIAKHPHNDTATYVEKTGSWTTEECATMYSVGTIAKTSTVGDTMDIHFTGDEVTIIARRNDRGQWNSDLTTYDIGASGQPGHGGVIEFLYGGSPYGGAGVNDLSCDGGHTTPYAAAPNTGMQFYYNLNGKDSPNLYNPPLLWSYPSRRLTGFGPGSHTITLRKKSGDSYPIYVDSWIDTNNENPPLVVLVCDGWYSDVNVSAGYNNTYVDQLVQIRKDVAAEAEFSGYVTVVDMQREGWSRNSMIFDTLHPNDIGHACFAAAIQDALARVSFREGINHLTSG